MAKDALAAQSPPLAEVAITVKSNGSSAAASTPKPTVMAKTYSRWYWVEATLETKVLVEAMKDEGTPREGDDAKMRTGCHRAQRDRTDWLFVHDFSESPGLAPALQR